MHIGHIECTCSSYLIFEIHFVKMAMACFGDFFFRKKWDFYMVTEYVLKHKKSVTPAPSYFVVRMVYSQYIRNMRTYVLNTCSI